MSILLNNSHWLLLLIFLAVFDRISLEMISEDSCDSVGVSVARWYTQVTNFVKGNENITQHFIDIHEKLNQLEEEVVVGQQKLDLSLQDLNNLKADLKQIKEKTNGDIDIQRRMDGTVNFQRTWAEYKEGFGNSSGEFFIGLDKLHKLTNSRPYELLIVMEDWDNDRRYARYDQFIVGSEVEKYILKELGNYSGSAGDSLTYHLGQKFTTKDQHNDPNRENCAVEYTGAWWYNTCHQSNLNGQYLKGTIKEFAVGTCWVTFRGYYYSLKFVEMIIRPI